MGVKTGACAIFLAVLAAGGCASLARFAPPGVMKYEEIAGDQPPNPVIEERIEESRAERPRSFPNLSEQPAAAPTRMRASAQRAELRALRDARDQVAAEVAEARELAATDRANGVFLPGRAGEGEKALDEARALLDEAVRKDDEAARRERGLPPRPEQRD